MFLIRPFGSLCAALLLLLAVASSPMRKDRPMWGPMVKVHLGNPWIPPLRGFEEQEKGEALAKAWLRSSAPPDPRACIGGFSANNIVPDIPVRFLDGSTVQVGAHDLDSGRLIGHELDPSGLYGWVGIYAHTQEGLLVYDRARSAWGWVARDFFDDVEVDFLETALMLRDEAINQGIPDGGDVPWFSYACMWVPRDKAAPIYRYGDDGKTDTPIGSLAPFSTIWPLAVDGDFLLVVPGEISPRNFLIQKPIVRDAHSPVYLTWHPRRPCWIRWREDGSVPGSKRLLIN